MTVIVAALLAVLPILLTGPSCGHDFNFHVLSWLEAASQFAHLHYPHWAFTPAWNAGEPRFLFYPPISWTLGALLGLILPWNLVPAAFTFIALALSGLTARSLAAKYVGANAATLAAVLYLANPYMLFTAYERTAFGELLAAAWLPLLVGAALAPRVRILPLAIPIALLWLTNAPAGVMACYALAFLILIRLLLPTELSNEQIRMPNVSTPTRGFPPLPRAPFIAPLSLAMSGSSRLHLALTTLAATTLGLALSAFYLLPAAFERKSIQSDMAVIEGMRIADNTLFHHMPPSTDNFAHDIVLHTASLITILLLVGIGIFALPNLRRQQAATPLLLLTLLIAILLTPLSLPVWAHTPELRFLQFPWRLDALLGVILSLTAALALSRVPAVDHLKPVRAAFLPVLLGILLTAPAWIVFHQECDLEDTVPARVALFHSSLGSEPTDEYTPVNADNDVLRHDDPPYWLVADSGADEAPNTAAPPGSMPGRAPIHLVLHLAKAEILILNLRAFPDRQIQLNGRPTTLLGRDDGLIALQLPAGEETIDVQYHRPLDQTAGLAISALACFGTLALARKRMTRQLDGPR